MILAHSIKWLWNSHGLFKWGLTQSSPHLVFSLTGRHGAAMDTEDCHGALAFVYCPPGLDSPLCRKVRSFYTAPVSLWSLSVLFSHSRSLISKSWILTSSFTPISHPKEWVTSWGWRLSVPGLRQSEQWWSAEKREKKIVRIMECCLRAWEGGQKEMDGKSLSLLHLKINNLLSLINLSKAEQESMFLNDPTCYRHMCNPARKTLSVHLLWFQTSCVAHWWARDFKANPRGASLTLANRITEIWLDLPSSCWNTTNATPDFI